MSSTQNDEVMEEAKDDEVMEEATSESKDDLTK
jgi:hypothetical protein